MRNSKQVRRPRHYPANWTSRHPRARSLALGHESRGPSASFPSATAIPPRRPTRRRGCDRVGEGTFEFVVDAVQVPVDEIEVELLVQARVIARDPRPQIAQRRRDGRDRFFRREALRAGLLALAEQFAKDLHGGVQQLLVAQGFAMSGDPDRGFEGVDTLQRLEPARRVDAQRKPDRIHQQVSRHHDLLLREIEVRVARCHRTAVIPYLDLAFAHMKGQPIGERDISEGVLH
jgi:hypothetical protein